MTNVDARWAIGAALVALVFLVNVIGVTNFLLGVGAIGFAVAALALISWVLLRRER